MFVVRFVNRYSFEVSPVCSVSVCVCSCDFVSRVCSSVAAPALVCIVK